MGIAAFPKARDLMIRVLPGLLLVAGTTAWAAEGNDSAEGAKRFSRTLYLVRHGAYDESPGADSPVGKGLVPLGREQARLAGEKLASLPHAPTSLTTSTMTRARETAAIIGEKLSLEARVTPLIAECLPFFREGELKARPMTNSQACEERVDRAYAQFMAPATDRERYDVIVFHGNAMRYWILKALGVETKAWPRLWVRNGSITTIRIDGNGTIRVLGIGDAGHLPPE